MLQRIGFLALLGAAVLAAACTSPFRADVTRFHQISKPSGETVEIVAADAAAGQSLAFRQYADTIGERLRALGYAPPVAGSPSELIAQLDYSVARGPAAAETRSRSPVRIGIGVGGGGSHSSVGIGMSTGVGERRALGTTHLHTLSLRISDRESGAVLFEGAATHLADSPEINRTMPQLIAALFQDFPGRNGKTERITLRLN